MSNDLRRYARQIVLPECGVAGQTALRDSTVLIVGLGGLGGVAAQYLCGAGVGRLWLADFDRVSLSNLHRQTLYAERDVGQHKTEAAAARLAAINADCELRVLPMGWDDPQTALALNACDLVLDCSDNFATRYAVNAACVQHKLPLVTAAAIRQEALVALLTPARGGACYHCLFPNTGADGELCEDSGVLGPVVGVAASLQALLAMQWLMGDAPAANRLQRWDARRHSWQSYTLRRDPDCPVCSTP